MTFPSRKNKPPRRSRLRRITIGLLAFSVTALGALFLYTWLSLPDVSGLKSQRPEMTALMRLRTIQAQKAGRSFTIHQEWIGFNRIPDLIKKTVRITEDASFYSHKGIDFAEMKESIKLNLKKRNFVRGGSTITQQLAKNLYLSTEKSLWRKLKEILIARRLEKALTKDRIFHLYLNTIEFGPGIFGVQAASKHYFGKDVSGLTLEEMIRLTAVIPRPLKSDPRKNSGWMKFKGRWIAHKLKLYRYISDEEYGLLMRAFQSST
ncbi:MAG: monofunctional biosynthetic peptidoglycan transglycosylase [Candidatus Aminicenantales bacterium]